MSINIVILIFLITRLPLYSSPSTSIDPPPTLMKEVSQMPHLEWVFSTTTVVPLLNILKASRFFLLDGDFNYDTIFHLITFVILCFIIIREALFIFDKFYPHKILFENLKIMVFNNNNRDKDFFRVFEYVRTVADDFSLKTLSDETLYSWLISGIYNI